MSKWTPQQEEAINSRGSNILVSAGAGSGKTTVLTTRVISLINEGVRLDQLLILTFTKASANDMKRQIREALEKQAAAGNLRMKEQLTLLDDADISTFDSYIYKLVSNNHFHLDISKNISILSKSEADVMKKSVLREVLNEFYLSGDKFFIRLLDDICAINDDELVRIILFFHDKTENIVDRKNYFFNYIDNYFSLYRQEKYCEYYLSLIKTKALQMKTLIDLGRQRIGDKKFHAYLDKIELIANNLNQRTYDRIKNCYVLLPRFSCGDAEEKELAADIKERIKTIYSKEIGNLLRHKSEADIYKQLDDIRQTLTILTRIISRFDDRLLDEKRAKNCYQYSDLTRLAISLLNTKEQLAKLKSKYKEIIVDESQDNNNLNDFFINLISENNAYSVGDIKQSIYRFRDSNPALFAKKYDNYKRNEGGKKIDFTFNFRSRKEVVTFINAIFSKIMDKNLGGADYQYEHLMMFGNTTLYPDLIDDNYQGSILRYDKTDLSSFAAAEKEIFIIASEIKRLINDKFLINRKVAGEMKQVPISYRDIAIISDTKKHFKLYKQVFSYLKIPLACNFDISQMNTNDIFALNNILKLILSYRDINYAKNNFRHNFYALARSFLFSYTDSYISETLIAIKEDCDAFAVIKNHSEFSAIYEKIKTLAETILPLDQVVLKTIEIFQFFENSYKIGDLKIIQDRIYNLISFISNKIATQPFVLQDLIELIDYHLTSGEDFKLNFSSPKDFDAVNLMSIHSSKGLEYPVIFLPHLTENFNFMDLRSKYAYNDVFQLIVPTFISKEAQTSIIGDLARDYEERQMIGEKIRLFYVACTRAREKLYFVAPLVESAPSLINNGVVIGEIRTKYRSYLSILNSLEESLNKHNDERYKDLIVDKNYLYSPTTLELPKNIDNKRIVFTDLPINIVQKPHRVASISKLGIFNKRTLENLRQGRHYHALLESLDFNKPLKQQLFTLPNNTAFISFLEMLIDFSKETPKLYQELPFFFESDNEYQGIIDMVIEKEDEVIIVDYKLRFVEASEYRKQLAVYQQYITSLFNKKVSLYLYSITTGAYQQIILEEAEVKTALTTK